MLDVQGDDAAALIQALSAGPVAVFGTSGGAQIGLNLAARYPELVSVLVAHEPPTIMLLDDPSAALAADREIYDTYRREGVDAAMQQFFAMNGLEDETEPGDTPPDFLPTPEEAATFERVSANFEYWLAHGMIPLSVYRPDVEALRAGTPRVVVGIGEQSTGQVIHDMGMALALKLGTEPSPSRATTWALARRPNGLPRSWIRRSAACDLLAPLDEGHVPSGRAWNSLSRVAIRSPTSTWLRRTPTVPSGSTKKLVPRPPDQP